ncbi:hypothetical protein TrST_g10090 [Triparma strigata]|uniref:Uncharacterized protein n=1 Tax=Triparma strigata TaxID=1606541 RepID=A0A9W7E3B2_9STRA|nr:hypothetical protein TrST_g10090 [Triparma strigata]
MRVLRTVPWGLKLRVTFGALISVTDVTTDVPIVFEYMQDKDSYWAAYFIMACISATMLFQCLISYGQYHKCGKERVLREVLPVMFGFKPMVDAYRVSSGKPGDSRFLTDHYMEMNTNRTVEMFAEAIPAGLIQVYMLLNLGNPTGVAMTSFITSALTTAYGSAIMSFDYDTNPFRRLATPNFYGMIPDSTFLRLSFILIMVLNSCATITGRSLAYAMLASIDPMYFLAIFLLDQGLYLGVKILRGDGWYWLPLDNGPLAVILAGLTRFVNKTVNDFAGIVQFRNASEIGGLWWTASMLYGQVLMWVSGYFYAEMRRKEEDVDEEESAGMMYKTLSLISGAWLLSASMFVALMDRSYLSTFTSVKTGHSDVKDKFRNPDSSPFQRVQIITKNKRLWKSIRPEVCTYFQENWVRWSKEQPAWFNRKLIAKIPDDFIPLEALDAIKRERRALEKNKRRSRGNRGKGKGKKSSSKVSPAVNQTLTTNTFILGDKIEEEEEGQDDQLIIYGERHNSYISNTSSTDNSGGSSVGV